MHKEMRRGRSSFQERSRNGLQSGSGRRAMWPHGRGGQGSRETEDPASALALAGMSLEASS